MKQDKGVLAPNVNLITEGPILKALLIFFFPILLGTFFQMLYNTADAVIVGQFVGKEALGAVGGSTGTLINLLVGFFTGLSSGATVVISQYYGAKNKEDLSKAVHTAIALSLAAGLILMIAGILLCPKIMVMMGTKDEILTYCISYIRIYFAGVIPSLLYNMGTGILRAVGDSKRPLYYLIISCLVNIVLDLLFVGVLHMATAGAALATILSQLVSAVLILSSLMNTKEDYKLSLHKIRFDLTVLKRIFHIGLPAGFQSTMYSVSNVIIQSFVNSFGTDTIAAWAAYGKIDQIFWMIIAALGISVSTFIGQNYGAQRLDRVKRCVRISLTLAFSITLVMTVMLYLFGKGIFLLFCDDAYVVEKGMEILHFLVPTFATYICIEVLASALRGMGDSVIPMIMTCLGVCVLRIVWLYFSKGQWPGNLQAILTCYPLTWSVTSILFIIYYRYKSKPLYCASGFAK